MNAQATKLQAAENDLKQLMADVTRAMEKAQEAALDALARLHEIGAKKFPLLTKEQQFARAFEDPANAELARKAHQRPAATTSYPFPR